MLTVSSSRHTLAKKTLSLPHGATCSSYFWDYQTVKHSLDLVFFLENKLVIARSLERKHLIVFKQIKIIVITNNHITRIGLTLVLLKLFRVRRLYVNNEHSNPSTYRVYRELRSLLWLRSYNCCWLVTRRLSWDCSWPTNVTGPGSSNLVIINNGLVFLLFLLFHRIPDTISRNSLKTTSSLLKSNSVFNKVYYLRWGNIKINDKDQ